MTGRRFDRTGWAMSQENLTCPQKCVLIIIADAADEVRGVCWLKHATIAERTSLGVSTVRHAITALGEHGLLRVAKRADRAGRQTSNYYQLGYYEAEEEIDWRVSGADTLRMDEGAGSGQGEVLGADTSYVNRPEGLSHKDQGKKKTPSPSSSRTRSPRSSRTAQLRQRQEDDEAAGDLVRDIHREMTPGREPEPEVSLGRRKRKPPTPHVHRPKRPNAGGLACYWAVQLHKLTGSLEPDEEVAVGKHFKRWLDLGADLDTLRGMVDLFFADPELRGSTHHLSRFVANGEDIRLRVLQNGPRVDEEEPVDWFAALPKVVREQIVAKRASA